MAETPLRRLRSCALAIICGKPEEISIIAKELDANEKISGTAVDGVDSGHLFHIGRMDFGRGNEAKTLRFYITSSLRQGLVPFAIATGALISVLRPRFAIHAGVCAGNAAQGMKLKHVICGDAAMSLEDGKWAHRNGQLVFLPDYETVTSPVAGLISFASAKKNVHYGFYVSGSAVREDCPAIFKRIEETVARKVLALEMEASAFIKLCAHSKHTNVQSLGVIKGVSDLGDASRDDDRDAYEEALEETGKTLKQWIRYCFTSMTWEPDEVLEGEEPGAKLAKSYYQNFIQRIVDAVSGGIPATQIVGQASFIHEDETPRLVVVMPPDDKVDQYAEQGQIDAIVNEYNLDCLSVGRRTFQRTVFFKGGILVDFPRTLNSLKHTDEPEYQTLVFRRYLERQPYFQKVGSIAAPAEVLMWQDFVDTFARMHDRTPSESVLSETPKM